MLDDQTVPVELNRLEIGVGEIALRQSNLQGMSLEDVKVTLEHASSGDVQWSDSGTGFTTLDTTLLLDWKLVLKDGDVGPSAQQRLEHVKFDLGFYLGDDGRLVADLTGGKEGSLGSSAEVGEMKNLAFDIHATK